MHPSVENTIRRYVCQEKLDRIRLTLENGAGIMRSLVTTDVTMDKLLWGGEAGTPAGKYARITRNPLRPSTPLAKTPHVKLLAAYAEIGESALETAYFEKSDYFRNALETMEIAGSYFDCRNPGEIVRHARRFVNSFIGKAKNDSGVEFASPEKMPVQVRRIAHSDGCYEVVDGHHRLAIACVRSEKSFPVYVRKEDPVMTPLQQLVLDVFWTKGKRLLYQPVDSPELGSKWRLVRQCADRFHMMHSFLEANRTHGDTASYLDVGSSYGWFIDQMRKQGYEAWGVERDPAAIDLGFLLYNVPRELVFKENLVSYLEMCVERFNVVSCFSVIHHFALGLGRISAEELLRLLDKVTNEVLFFDTGQEHEMWFRESLRGWNPEFIADWISRNSSFTHVTALGVDQDSQLPGQKFNYGRTLFACTRK